MTSGPAGCSWVAVPLRNSIQARPAPARVTTIEAMVITVCDSTPACSPPASASGSTGVSQSGTLVVSEHARVDGEISVSHIVINGTVNGPVHASAYLEMQPKARVTGDVSYKTLEMHVGAVIQGRLNHGLDEPGSASVVELKRVQG